MQFEHRTKRTKLSNDNTNNGRSTNPYPYWINFYTTPPDYKVTLQEIESMVSERLKILSIIDNLFRNVEKTRGIYDVIISQINSLKCENNEKNFYTAGRCSSNEMNPSKTFEARKRDHISHFLLRIYYCQNEELRRWFISKETELFRIRFIDSSLTNTTQLEECLLYYGYKFEIISTAKNPELHQKINWTEYSRHQQMIAFKLPFEEALDLIRSRKIYLNDGYAYIGTNEIVSVLCQRFKTNLACELNRMHTYFYSLNEPRLIWRLDSLHKHYILNDKLKNSKINNNQNENDDNEKRQRIYVNQIDELSRDSFPPCMRSIHETLRREHHLKHYGRLYYGLFLKAAGLTMDDSMEFFRNELSIKNPEKFQKEYSYTIRYLYGKAGKRQQLSAYSCQKIINENAPGPTDAHGCPFRHFDIKNLKALLIRYGVNNENDLQNIIDKITQDKNYTGACAKFFSVKYNLNNSPDQPTIYHPNQYFQLARSTLKQQQMQTCVNDDCDEEKNMKKLEINAQIIDDSIDDDLASTIDNVN